MDPEQPKEVCGELMCAPWVAVTPGRTWPPGPRARGGYPTGNIPLPAAMPPLSPFPGDTAEPGGRAQPSSGDCSPCPAGGVDFPLGRGHIPSANPPGEDEAPQWGSTALSIADSSCSQEGRSGQLSDIWPQQTSAQHHPQPPALRCTTMGEQEGLSQLCPWDAATKAEISLPAAPLQQKAARARRAGSSSRSIAAHAPLHPRLRARPPRRSI